MCLISHTISHFVNAISCTFNNMLVFRISKRLFHCERDIIVLCVYLPPVDSPYYQRMNVANGIQELENCLLHISTEHPDCSLIVCGDFNARTGNYNVGDACECMDSRYDVPYEFRNSVDGVTNDYGIGLLSVCLGFDLSIMNGGIDGDMTGNYTYISGTGNSVIDYYLVSRELVKICKHLIVRENVLTSHLCMELYIECHHNFTEEITQSYQVSKYVWDPNRAEQFSDALMVNIEEMNMNDMGESIEIDIDARILELSDCLLRAAKPMKRHFTIGKSRYKQPWYDKDCFVARQSLKSLYRRYVRAYSPALKKTYMKQRNEYQRLIREKKISHRKNVLSALVSCLYNPSDFWRQVRAINRKSFGRCPIKVDVWKNYFKDLLIQHSDFEAQPLDSSFIKYVADDLTGLDSEITVDEVKCAISKLKGGKSVGCDEISTEMIKNMPESVLVLFTNLFNVMYSRSHYPNSWKQTIILPILKKGDPSNPDNYRGISITSVLSKVFMSILTDRLNSWAEDNQIIVEEQAGFRKGYSTVDNIFVLHSIIQHYLQRKRKVYVAFVDFKKAFDTVSKEALWDILHRHGIQGRFLKMLQAIYSQVICKVRCNGDYSEPFDSYSGLKQGCKMSPIIFAMIVNYVANVIIQNGKHGVQISPDNVIYLLLYADDIVLISDTIVGLQNQLNHLKKGADAVGLTVNREKTKVMVFRNGGYLSAKERWFLGTDRLECVSEYRYLGSLFTIKLSCNQFQKDLVQRAKANTTQVIRCIRKLQCVSPDAFFKMLDAQIISVVLYSSEVWGLYDCSVIETVHLEALKRFLNLPIRVPNLIVYGETGRYPIFVNGIIRAVRYWLRILRMESSRYPHMVYTKMKNSTQKNWAHQIKEMLSKYGFENLWSSQNVDNETEFLRDLKQRIVHHYIDNWKRALTGSERYSFYRSIKPVWGREKYLYVLDRKPFRDVYVQFRSGFSELYIHKLRYSREDVENMYVCPSCTEEYECELHLLYGCPVYEDIRRKYLHNILEVNTVEQLFSNSDPWGLRAMSMFLYYAFKRRREAAEVDVADN